ncbi:MAG: cysteine desulfurase [Candidatus Electryonea clarkiae]|nr:cysteine desulfurase [Candidatus Electryonea clarkiae]MDP8285308.1 cysteine desulfurase [Candidatus Electryonea clarkiae]
MPETLEKAGNITVLDPRQIQMDFPLLSRRINGTHLVYLDNAATTQKPESVLKALNDYYTNHNANVHRGLHTLADEATRIYENTRDTVAEFIGGVKREEIIFTGGATEAINLVAYSWGMDNLKPGDRILLTEMEHHANLVPWIRIAKQTGAELDYIPFDDSGCLIIDDLDSLITDNTKIVAVTQMSNVFGTINPVQEIIEMAHQKGALVLIDAAQSVPHMPVNVLELDADFLVFSAHKMLGPTGVGVLYGKQELLESMEPFHSGGEMINEVTWDNATWAELPHKFEAGTPNIAGVAGFQAAIEYLDHIGMDAVRHHEKVITKYALDQMSELEFINIIGPKDVNIRGGAISFTGAGLLHPHDIAQVLDSHGIAVRAGHHCAQPLHRKLGVGSSARASFYIYNTNDDVDAFIEGLIAVKDYFGV